MVNEEVNRVSREEVKNALKRMKKGKAVGPDELPVEVWKCMGKMGIEFLTRLFNRLLMGARVAFLLYRAATALRVLFLSSITQNQIVNVELPSLYFHRFSISVISNLLLSLFAANI